MKTDDSQVKEVLRKQLELLAEVSKVTAGPGFLANLSLAMVEIAKLL